MEINELAKALALAQSEICGAVKDSINPHFKSKYADLESVWEAIRVPLSKNGLSVAQLTDLTSDGKLVLRSMLMHTSGQSLTSTMPVLMVQQTPQAAGSAISYARRYALAALVGVYQTDDDAEAATRGSNGKSDKSFAKNNDAERSQLKTDERKSGIEREAKTGGGNEQQAPQVDSGKQLITGQQMSALLQKLKAKGKDGQKFYDWLFQTYETRNPMQLTVEQYSSVMELIDGEK